MNITYKKGNLLDAFDAGEFDVIAHQCNCFCNMGRGIAPQIKNRYPKVYEADQSTVSGDESKMGSLTYGPAGKGFVFNLYGQYGYGNHHRSGTEYISLRAAMVKMNNILDEMGVTKLGLPKIGCGLGGGSWGIVEEIILTVFKGKEVIVYEL